MKVYDGISCSAEYMDTPQWVAVALNANDHEHIEFAKALLAGHEFIQKLNIDLDGNWQMDEVEGKWKYWELIVTRYNVWFKCTNDWSGDSFEVCLDEESTDWFWDEEADIAKEAQ